jgi:hypothetical protein
MKSGLRQSNTGTQENPTLIAAGGTGHCRRSMEIF